MSNIWRVNINKDSVSMDDEQGGLYMPEYRFFHYYLCSIIEDKDVVLIPDRIIFNLNGAHYAMPYILTALHQLSQQHPCLFQNIHFEFLSTNKILADTYQRVIFKMRKHTQFNYT